MSYGKGNGAVVQDRRGVNRRNSAHVEERGEDGGGRQVDVR